VYTRISTRISDGKDEIGHGGAGECSVGGGAGGIDKFEKHAIRSEIDRVWSCGEPRVAFTEASDEFGFPGFVGKEEGGKCLFLYFWSTRSSI
jgi:hypothetical protein